MIRHLQQITAGQLFWHSSVKQTFLSSFSILGSTGSGCFPADESAEATPSPPPPCSRSKLSPTVDASASAATGPEPSVLARAKLSFLRLQPALLQESVADGGRSAAATGRNAQPPRPLAGLLTHSCIAPEDYVGGEGMGNRWFSHLSTLRPAVLKLLQGRVSPAPGRPTAQRDGLDDARRSGEGCGDHASSRKERARRGCAGSAWAAGGAG
jgi:hypothetical protein